jgi:hypothetical protein
MKLHSRIFERRLLKQARQECRADRDLRKKWRNAKKKNSLREPIRNAIAAFLKAAVLAGLVGSVGGAMGLGDEWHMLMRPCTERDSFVISAIVGIWWAVAFLWGSRIIREKYKAEAMPLLLLPISASELIELVGERTRWLAARSFVDALVTFVTLSVILHQGIMGLGVALFLSLLYASSLWAGCVCLSAIPIPSKITSSPFWAGLVIILAAKFGGYGPQMWAWFHAHARMLTLFLPGGWIAASQMAVTGAVDNGFLLLLIPLVVVAASAPWAYRRYLRQINPE